MSHIFSEQSIITEFRSGTNHDSPTRVREARNCRLGCERPRSGCCLLADVPPHSCYYKDKSPLSIPPQASSTYPGTLEPAAVLPSAFLARAMVCRCALMKIDRISTAISSPFPTPRLCAGLRSSTSIITCKRMHQAPTPRPGPPASTRRRRRTCSACPENNRRSESLQRLRSKISENNVTAVPSLCPIKASSEFAWCAPQFHALNSRCSTSVAFGDLNVRM